MRRLARTSVLLLVLGCGAAPAPPAPLLEAPVPVTAPSPSPETPVSAASAPASSIAAASEVTPAAPPPPPCPEEMVLVADRFCIDRYEATMVDRTSGRSFSPFYPPSKEVRKAIAGQTWGPAALGKEEIDPPVPKLPDWQRGSDVQARAVSVAHVVPQAYMSKHTARAACETAGKRLCSLAEWKQACRGEQNRRYPYGDKYKRAVCNVHGNSHPASILYGNASLGHWDPRLNQVTVDGAPLLRATGDTPACRSVWGNDAIYDMVGNLDEWIEDDKPTFVGGFYARDTFRGCDARVSRHPAVFFDFTTGVRCCAERRDGKASSPESAPLDPSITTITTSTTSSDASAPESTPSRSNPAGHL